MSCRIDSIVFPCCLSQVPFRFHLLTDERERVLIRLSTISSERARVRVRADSVCTGLSLKGGVLGVFVVHRYRSDSERLFGGVEGGECDEDTIYLPTYKMSCV